MSRDYEEFIAALNAHKARYLIIGAHAVAFHARPRATKDLDILVDPTRTNARRVLAALREFFGGADLGYTVDDLANPHWIIQLGIAPVRIDLLTVLTGSPSFAILWHNRVEGRFGDIPAHYLGLDDLIVSKEAAGRPQDQADVVALSKVKKRTAKRRTPRSPSGRG